MYAAPVGQSITKVDGSVLVVGWHRGTVYTMRRVDALPRLGAVRKRDEAGGLTFPRLTFIVRCHWGGWTGIIDGRRCAPECDVER